MSQTLLGDLSLWGELGFVSLIRAAEQALGDGSMSWGLNAHLALPFSTGSQRNTTEQSLRQQRATCWAWTY